MCWGGRGSAVMAANAPRALIASAAVLRVRNVVASANHYRDTMGFGYDRFYGETPVFVIVSRDDMYLMLKQVADAGIISPHRTVGVDSDVPISGRPPRTRCTRSLSAAAPGSPTACTCRITAARNSPWRISTVTRSGSARSLPRTAPSSFFQPYLNWSSPPQRRKLERLRRPEPDHVIGVILQRVAGLRVGEDREAFSVEDQPGDDLGELLVLDRELAASARMRADRIVVHAADLDAECARRPPRRAPPPARACRRRNRRGRDSSRSRSSVRSTAHSRRRSSGWKNRFSGRGRPRFSRSVLPSYSLPEQAAPLQLRHHAGCRSRRARPADRGTAP